MRARKEAGQLGVRLLIVPAASGAATPRSTQRAAPLMDEGERPGRRRQPARDRTRTGAGRALVVGVECEHRAGGGCKGGAARVDGGDRLVRQRVRPSPPRRRRAASRAAPPRPRWRPRRRDRRWLPSMRQPGVVALDAIDAVREADRRACFARARPARAPERPCRGRPAGSSRSAPPGSPVNASWRTRRKTAPLASA
jgi:hypothetical protein